MVTTASRNLSQRIEAARPNFKVIVKDKENTFFKNKYATLDGVIAAVQQALVDEGVRIATRTIMLDSGEFVIGVRLVVIDTEEYEESTFPLTVGKPQEQGVAITYARRYALTAMLNLCTEDDNDGNLVAEKTERQAERKAEKAVAPATVAPQTNVW